MATKMLLGRPVEAGIPVSSGFGLTRTIDGKTAVHHGVDFAAPMGSVVYAMADGMVYRIGYEDALDHSKGLGYRVWISSIIGDRRIWLWHGHLSEISVQPGQEVKKGQPIGKSGNTGHSTGPHLHVQAKDVELQEWLEPIFDGEVAVQ